MSETKPHTPMATFHIDDRTFEYPVLTGTLGNRSIDISKLYTQSGVTMLDPAFGNTAESVSNITYIDGENGKLLYRGYRVEELAERCRFLEVAYLLIYGDLPNEEQFNRFRDEIRYHTMMPEGMRRQFEGFPQHAHPMAILGSMTGALAVLYSDCLDPKDPDHRKLAIHRAMGKLPTIAAYSYKQSSGQPFMYPRNDLNYVENFLQMMFGTPCETYQVDSVYAEALNVLLILHADHGQNCSTSSVRMVGSSNVDLFSALSAGVCALWGALHGGANEACIRMLEKIEQDGRDLGKYIAKAKDSNDPFRLMGFGHRIYKNHDPRARIIKRIADKVLTRLKIRDPLFDLAMELEEYALKDPYFVERRLYPNVDFYSGIIYKALGIPPQMFTVLFALGRLPGWIAHWLEMHVSPNPRIHRPRQLYRGPGEREFVAMPQRPGAPYTVGPATMGTALDTSVNAES